MGSLTFEYVEPLDVRVMRAGGHVGVGALVSTVIECARRQPGSNYLWDISEVSFDDWPAHRVVALLRSLQPIAAMFPPIKTALVGSNPLAAGMCAIIRDLMIEHRYPLEPQVFASRREALDWLGVMNMPIGA